MPRHDLSDMTYDFVSLVDFPANRPAQVVLAKRDVTKGGRITEDDPGFEGDDEENPSHAVRTTRAREIGKNDTPSPTTTSGGRSRNPVTNDNEGGVPEEEHPSTQPTATGDRPQGAASPARKGGRLSADEMGLENVDDEDGDDLDGRPVESQRSPNETGRLRGAARTSKGAHSPMPQSAVEKADDLPEVITKADLAEILKGYDERVEKAEARAAAAESLAKSEADKVAKRDAIAKATTWSHIPQLEPESFGDTWLSLQKSNPDAVEVLEKIFDATEAALSTGGGSIYTATGRANIAASSAVTKGGDPMAPITAAAVQLRKSDPTLSMPQAIAKVMQVQPELAAAYRESMGFIPEGGYTNY